MKYELIVIFSFLTLIPFSFGFVNAEEYTIHIPFGAFNPQLNTPTEVWYDPPKLSIFVDDKIT